MIPLQRGISLARPSTVRASTFQQEDDLAMTTTRQLKAKATFMQKLSVGIFVIVQILLIIGGFLLWTQTNQLDLSTSDENAALKAENFQLKNQLSSLLVEQNNLQGAYAQVIVQNFNSSNTRIFSASSVGSISWFLQGDSPSGFLPLDGSNVSRTNYAYLWKYVSEIQKNLLCGQSNCGRLFGIGNGISTFTLPDMRDLLFSSVNSNRDYFDAYDDFASAQNSAGNWSYLYSINDNFTQMQYVSANRWQHPSSANLLITKNEADYPNILIMNPSLNSRSILAWNAPNSGEATVYFNARKASTCTPAPTSNGVIVIVRHDNEEIFKAKVAENDNIGATLNVNRKVSKGDVIYFMIDSNGESSCDDVGVNARITLDKPIEMPMRPFIKF